MGSSSPLSDEALALLDAAACGLMQTTANGTFLRVNRTFTTWLGYTSDELVGRRRLQDLLTMGARIFHQTHWAPLLQMQGSISEVKLEVLHKDGHPIPMVLNALRHEHAGETVHELAAYVARDRDKYERELLLSRRHLEEAVSESRRLQEEAKDRALFAEQMIGIVSHDLRNPLAAIAMGAALLARENLSTVQQHTLTRVRRSTDRANRLIGDLLDFTQARVGTGLAVALENIDVHQVVSEAVDELIQVYPARALVHLREGAGAGAGDANRLTQLVGNLVSNAIAYGDPERPVTVTSSVAPGSFAITVHNDGAPVPSELQSSIFNAMTRGADASNAGRSVGLGLFIVREIARAHGGSASLHSTLAEGTTFRATFPRS